MNLLQRNESADRAEQALRTGVDCLRAEAPPEDGQQSALAAVGLTETVWHAPRLAALRRRRVLARAFGLAAVLLVLMTGGWVVYADIDPPAPGPDRVLRSPNAYDVLRTVGGRVTDDKKVANLLKRLEPASRARPAARPAAADLAAAERLLAENAPVLRDVRRALKTPYEEPPVRSPEHLFTHLAGYRKAARLLALEARVRAARGDAAGAIDSALDAVALGVHVVRGGVIINRLVGVACESIGREAAWDIADRLDARAARGAAQRLERIEGARIPLADTLEEERRSLLANLRQLMSRPRWRLELWPQMNPEPRTDHERLTALALAAWSYRWTKSGILANCDEMMTRMIADARSGKFARASAAFTTKDLLARDPITLALTPAFDGILMTDLARARVQNRLLMAKLAVHAFRTERGRLPRSLEELVPGYLARVPDDPFLDGRTLRYRRTKEGYTLYSVGPDRFDNGGEPVASDAQATAGSGRRQQSTQPGAIGDMVAGVNRQ